MKEGSVIARVLFASLVVSLSGGSCRAAEVVAAGAEPAIAFVVPADQQALDAVAPGLARQVLKVLPQAARDQDLMGALQLEMVAGDYPAAQSTLVALRQRYRTVGAPLALLVYPEWM